MPHRSLPKRDPNSKVETDPFQAPGLFTYESGQPGSSSFNGGVEFGSAGTGLGLGFGIGLGRGAGSKRTAETQDGGGMGRGRGRGKRVKGEVVEVVDVAEEVEEDEEDGDDFT